MHFCFDKNLQEGVPATVQWSKDLALPQLWCRAQLWLGFDPWPRNFNMLQLQTKKKKKKSSAHSCPYLSHHAPGRQHRPITTAPANSLSPSAGSPAALSSIWVTPLDW